MSNSPPDLAALLPSWQLSMRAERKSAATIASYSEGVLGFLRWAKTSNVTPEITKTNVQAFTAELLDNGAQAATARTRHMGFAGSRRGWPTKARSTPTRCSASNRPNSIRKSSTRCPTSNSDCSSRRAPARK